MINFPINLFGMCSKICTANIDLPSQYVLVQIHPESLPAALVYVLHRKNLAVVVVVPMEALRTLPGPLCQPVNIRRLSVNHAQRDG